MCGILVRAVRVDEFSREFSFVKSLIVYLSSMPSEVVIITKETITEQYRFLVSFVEV